jgi:hypothetical protein
MAILLLVSWCAVHLGRHHRFRSATMPKVRATQVHATQVSSCYEVEYTGSPSGQISLAGILALSTGRHDPAGRGRWTFVIDPDRMNQTFPSRLLEGECYLETNGDVSRGLYKSTGTFFEVIHQAYIHYDDFGEKEGRSWGCSESQQRENESRTWILAGSELEISWGGLSRTWTSKLHTHDRGASFYSTECTHGWLFKQCSSPKTTGVGTTQLSAGADEGQHAWLQTEDGSNLQSSYSCLGHQWYDTPKSGIPPHCKFTNICYSTAERQWAYFRDPTLEQIPLMFTKTGEAVTGRFPDCFTFTHGKNIHCFSPQVIHTPVPGHAEYSSAKTLVLRTVDLSPSNFGHLMFEFILSITNILQMFSLHSPKDVQIMFLNTEMSAHCCLEPTVNYVDQSADLLQAFRMFKAGWIKLVTTHAAPFISPSTVADQGGGLTCFENVVVGDWGLDIFWTNPGGRYIKPGLTYWPKLIKDQKHEGAMLPSLLGLFQWNRPSFRPHLTILVKSGRRIPVNYAEFTMKLRSLETDVSVLSFKGKPPTMSQQLSILQQTQILVTPAGGAAAAALFLPPGASLVLFAIFKTTEPRGMYDYDQDHWQAFSHFTVKHFPVLPSDYEMAGVSLLKGKGCGGEHIEDKAHEDELGVFTFCNYWVNSSRLVGMVRDELALQQSAGAQPASATRRIHLKGKISAC